MSISAWPEQRPAAIAWDLDGTLVDSAADLSTALNALLARRGLDPLALEAVRGMVGQGAARLIERGFAARGQPIEPAEAAQLVPEFLRLYGPVAVDETAPFPGVRDIVARISAAGIPQVVCTNKPEAVSRQILGALELDRFFSNVVGGDSTPRRKPDPLPLLTSLGRLGFEFSHCLMIGDSATDVATARAAGIPVTAVAWGYTRVPPQELGSDYLLADLVAQQPCWLP